MIRKKIAVISSGHIPSNWAHSINTVEAANGFYKANQDVELFSPLRWNEAKLLRKIKSIHKYYGIPHSISVNLIRDTTFHYYQEIFPLNRFFELNARFFTPRTDSHHDIENKIAKMVFKNNFSLAYCRCYRAPIHCINYGIDTIIETHSGNIKNPDLIRLFSLAKNKHFIGIITISEILKERYVEAGVPKEKIIILNGGVDIRKFHFRDPSYARRKMGISSTSKIVTYSGSLSPDRGIFYLINAAKNLKDIQFLFIGGNGNQIRFWKKRCAENKISNVLFMGYVEHYRVPLLLAASDILILPYTSDLETYQWMSPIKLFEYIAAGKPIIASDLSSLTKLLHNNLNSLVIPEKNSRAIEDAIFLLLSNPLLAARISSQAASDAKLFDIKERAVSILKYFNLQ